MRLHGFSILREPPVELVPEARLVLRRRWSRERASMYAEHGANLESRAVAEHVVAVQHEPCVTARPGAHIILVVVDCIASIPVFVLNRCARLPFLVLDMRVVVAMRLERFRFTC